MSRIAKNPIKISKDIECTFSNGVFSAKGKLGKIEIKRGDWLVDEFQSGTSERLHANVFSLKGENFKDGMPIHFHLGASDTTGRLFLCDKDQSARERTAFLVLKKDIHSVKGDRFVLRDQAAEKTIGGGVVCELAAVRWLRYRGANGEGGPCLHELSLSNDLDWRHCQLRPRSWLADPVPEMWPRAGANSDL